MITIAKMILHQFIATVDEYEKVKTNKIYKIHDLEYKLNQFHDLSQVDFLSYEYMILYHVNPLLFIIQ